MSEQAIDPQFVESFNKIKAQVGEFQQFMSDVQAKRADMQTAFADLTQKKSLIDGISTGAESAKQRIEESERHIGEHKGKIDSDAQTIGTTKTRFEDLKTQAEKLHGELSSQQTTLQNQVNEIQAKIEVLKNLEQQLTDLKNAATTSKDNIENTYQAIQNQQQTFQQAVEQTGQKLTDLNAQQAALSGKIQEIENCHSAIVESYNELLIDQKDQQGAITESSVSTQIKGLLQSIRDEYGAIKQEHVVQRESFSSLHNELSEKINSLLPGAGAAGLASSYYEAKMRYTPMTDVFSDSPNGKKTSWKDKLVAIFTQQRIAYLFNLALFLGPLGWLIWTFIDFKYPAIFENQPVEALVYRFAVSLPAIGVSTYGVFQIMVNRRLYEDYNHKQRVMQLYHSFKKEIEATSDETLKIKLLNVMLDVVQDKPSTKMGRSDKFLYKGLLSLIGKDSGKT